MKDFHGKLDRGLHARHVLSHVHYVMPELYQFILIWQYLYLSDFDVKLKKGILVIFSHINICFEKRGSRNERGHT
jgi:hypothetical protein